MQITDLYQTKITCSTYNADIDSTNTVITVKLVDFNGAAVTNKSVTLTCDKGYFNKNGSTTISGTTTKSITATTNSSGEITATWTASEWGLCTFSANNNTVQVNVTGWKTDNSGTQDLGTLLYNETTVQFRIAIESQTTISNSMKIFTGQTIPNYLKPNKPVSTIGFGSGQPMIIQVRDNGSIYNRSVDATSYNSSIYCIIEWSR